MGAFFEEVTPGQIRDFMRRTDPRAEGAISRVWFQSFLDGRLILRDDAGLGEDGGVFIQTEPLVQAMIRAGIHRVTNHGKGMKAAAYRHLWPHEVPQPPQYAGRFDRVLLVDTTVELAALVKHGNVAAHTDPASCKDMVPALTRPDGAPLTRYIAFFQGGAKNKSRSVEDCRATLAEDELGLVTREGLHLPIQYESILRDHAVDLPGSRYGDWGAPYVLWFAYDPPEFHVYGIRSGHPSYGSASRGSVVIPVT